MLKMIVAMVIGAVFGAALTHGIMSRRDVAPPQAAAAVAEPVAPPVPLEQRPARAVPVAVPAGSAPPPVRAARVVTPPGGVVPLAGAPGAVAADSTLVDDAQSFEDAFSRVLGGSDGDRAVLGAMQSIAERWLVDSPAQVIAALDRIDSPRRRQAYLTALARVAASRQPELLPDIVGRLRGMSEQGSVVNGVAQALQTAENPESLLGVADTLPGMLGRIVERMVYSQLAARDPLAALARIDAMPPGEDRQLMMMQSVVQLAANDAESALSWLSAHPYELDANLYANAAGAVASQDPQLAARYAPSVPESARGAWISAVARSMAASDVDGALSWLGTWRNTDFYSDAVVGVVQQVATFDPPRAAQMLGELDTDTPQGRAVVSGVAAMWSGSDPDAAVAWARSLPRGETRDRALVSLAPRIGEAMLDDTMLDLFDSDQLRDAATGGAITAIARTDPQRAGQLADAYPVDPAMVQEIGIIAARGAPGVGIATFAAPVGVDFAPSGGAVFFSDVVVGVPQLSVNGDVTSVVLSGAEQER